MANLAWKDLTKMTVSAGGTGTLTLGSTSSGYQAFAAGDDAKFFPYSIQDGTAWETGYGKYTHSGTTFARTLRFASSTGSALTVTTAALLWVDLVSSVALATANGASAIVPGGRLTLTSGVPVTSADVTGATNVFYTPYTSDQVSLWDGNVWAPSTFPELTLAVGTVTSGLLYDAFLSNGGVYGATPTISKTAWTNGTTRATAITLTDGRYTLSGDKTKLYIGTFCATSTTTTEDSAGATTTQVGAKRFLFNMYNRVERSLAVFDSTNAWTYSSTTIRQANGASGNKVEFITGVAEDAVRVRVNGAIYVTSPAGGFVAIGVGLDTTTGFSGQTATMFESSSMPSNIYFNMSGEYVGVPAAGYHYVSWNEQSNATGTSNSFRGLDSPAQVGMVTGNLFA